MRQHFPTTVKQISCLSFAALLAIGAGTAFAGSGGDDQSQSASNFVDDSKTQLSFRYRYEGVDQDGIGDDAGANTLRTRLSWTSGTVSGFSGKIEFDDSRIIGSEHFNSTANGKGQYPVVADPEGTEVNQAYVQYKNSNWQLRAGRQGIKLDDQRFVGTVGWRQNEQTFDGVRAQYQQDAFKVDYSYVDNVNRIFGPDGPKADLEGQIHLLNASYQINKQHKITAFNYSLDFDTAAALSSNTYGLRYAGKLDQFKLIASYARQADTADNPTSYDADYGLIEVSTKIEGLGIKVGYEVLGSDNGNKAFTTPLATLHKFQGFSDKFLATPAAGIEDAYIGFSTKAAGLTFKLAYHQLESEHGSIDYGNEWNAAVVYPVNKNFKALVKYANYSADQHATDTQKLWLQLQYTL